MIVVRDEGDFVALWFPKGTRWKAPTTPPTRPREHTRGERLARCLVLRDWVFVDSAWDVSTLVLMREGDWHALWVSWLDDGEHWGWYVNLQEPYRRTAKGFETMDLALDVVISTDGRWRWKDEDELETFVAHGVLDDALATRLRKEGLDVVRRAQRIEPPFSEPWPSWQPDPGWGMPKLPAEWDERCH
jgi:hypothetical protein